MEPEHKRDRKDGAAASGCRGDDRLDDTRFATRYRDSMQSWSVNATKLMSLVGVRAPIDPVNGKATDLNKDAENVELACAAADTHA